MNEIYTWVPFFRSTQGGQFIYLNEFPYKIIRIHYSGITSLLVLLAMATLLSFSFLASSKLLGTTVYPCRSLRPASYSCHICHLKMSAFWAMWIAVWISGRLDLPADSKLGSRGSFHSEAMGCILALSFGWPFFGWLHHFITGSRCWVLEMWGWNSLVSVWYKASPLKDLEKLIAAS